MTRISGARSTLAWMLSAAALVALVVVIYRPALAGGFLFDDIANLPALGRYGPVVDLPSLLRYLSSGIADPTGRPLAMLSFLIDANDWPAEPWPFKRTNLAIHALNALLLLQVLRQLGRYAGLPDGQSGKAALIAAALWAVHPLWVSSVAYIVQRHALLATTFVLLGLSIWLAAQAAFATRQARRGWALALIAVCGCGLLAGLSKPIGFLLPVLLLAIHATLGEAAAGRREAVAKWPMDVRILLILPTVLIVVGIALYAATADTQDRNWSLTQRGLSQPRAILSYLRYLLLPTPYSPGLFADDFQVSTDLFHPVSTLPALLVVLAALALGVAARRRQPLLALAILFFFAGHLLESSVLPLELYFEHRNYLPTLLLFWPLALWLMAPGRLPVWRHGGAVALVLLLSLLTLVRASVWGDSGQLAVQWARDLPDSARAQAFAASKLVEAGQVDAAFALVRPQLDRRPDDPQLAITLANLQCLSGPIETSALAAMAQAAARHGIGVDILHQWIIGVLKRSPSAPCRGLESATVMPVISGLRAHPRRTVEDQSRLARVDGFLLLREGHCEEALAAFNRRLDIQRRPEAVVDQIGYLASACGDAFGLRHLEHFRAGAARGYARLHPGMSRVRDWLMQRQGYWDRELERLEQVMRSAGDEDRGNDRMQRESGPADAGTAQCSTAQPCMSQ